jgi:hypothetical protein
MSRPAALVVGGDYEAKVVPDSLRYLLPLNRRYSAKKPALPLYRASFDWLIGDHIAFRLPEEHNECDAAYATTP